MVRTLSIFLYKIILFTDLVFLKLTNRRFLPWIKNFIEADAYFSIPINNKNIKFFIPNQITQWRVDTFFTKEPETLEWIDNFDRDEQIIFWDIGANIGLYSLYTATKYKNSKVISFEPSTSNLRVLSRNISINNLEDQITINQLALTNAENQFLMMRESSFQEGAALNSFGEDINHSGDTLTSQNNYKILGTSINYLLKQKILDIPSYIKIDVDGIEHFILKGANEFLSNKKIKSISVELNEEFKEQYEQVFDILNNAGFTFKSKKHSKIFDKNSVHSTSYNFIFDKCS